MTTLKDFESRQQEIADLISDLKTMLNPDYLRIKPNAKTAHNQICTLGERMKSHLAAEDSGLYPPLLTQEDPKLKSLAWGFISGQKPLRKQFEAYHQRWIKDCDFEFSASFIEATQQLIDAIEERLMRESTILIPKLEASGLFARA